MPLANTEFLTKGLACLECRPRVEAAVYDAQFFPTLANLWLPLFLVAVLGVALGFARSREE